MLRKIKENYAKNNINQFSLFLNNNTSLGLDHLRLSDSLILISSFVDIL